MPNDSAIDEMELEFEGILAEFTTRVRDNESPEVETWAARYPRHSNQILELFPLVACLESTKQSTGSTTNAGRWKVPVLEHLGEYELIREIGRGGMGIVYEARQASLDRRVALKVLPQDRALTGKGLARFQREARLAASLLHSNIVPILGTGKCAGTHYIAMQLIDGVGLDRVIAAMIQRRDKEAGLGDVAEENVQESEEQKSREIDADDPINHETASAETSIAELLESNNPSDETYWRKVARIGCQVAQALTHAHENNVVHRDIKPSNLIIDRNGKTWVADFGLARSFEGLAPGDMTEAAGTPRYMAPEQISGPATTSSDIFSLGLTLYELVSLQRVYSAKSSGGVEGVEALHREKTKALQPLSSFVDDIPGDLNTILMKCVAQDPRKRYSGAAAMADDFERFLDGRSLAETRTPAIVRLRRWAANNPQTAIATGLAVLSLATAAVVSSLSYLREHQQRQKIEVALQLSMETLDTVYDRLSPETDSVPWQPSPEMDDIASRPPLSNINADLMNELLASYDQLAQLDGDNREIRLAAAKAKFRVGEIHRRIGNSTDARVALLDAIDAFRTLGRQSEPVAMAVEIARSLNALGSIGNPEDDRRVRSQYLMEVISVVDEVESTATIDSTDYFDLRYEKARALFMLGTQPKPPPGLPARPARSGDKKGDRKSPPPRPTKLEPDAATVAYLDRAIGILEMWQLPSPAKITNLLSLCYGERSREFNDSDAQLAVRLQESLVRKYPDSREFIANLAQLYAMPDPHFLKPEQYSAAIEQLKRAIRLASQLDPNDMHVNTMLQHTNHKLAGMLFLVARNKGNIFDEGILDEIDRKAQQSSIDGAFEYASKAIEHQDSGLRRMGNQAGDFGTNNATRKAWRLRFRLTLGQILWVRNKGRDREKAEALIKESFNIAGAIDNTTTNGRMLGRILRQIADIPKSGE